MPVQRREDDDDYCEWAGLCFSLAGWLRVSMEYWLFLFEKEGPAA